MDSLVLQDILSYERHALFPFDKFRTGIMFTYLKQGIFPSISPVETMYKGSVTVMCTHVALDMETRVLRNTVKVIPGAYLSPRQALPF